jgi:hypothetical protein
VTEPHTTPPDPKTSGANALRDRLVIVLIAAAVFIGLLVATAITQNNALGTIVAVYGIVGGVLLGRLLAKAERARTA